MTYNKEIITRGTIVEATKLPVITIGIGKVADLQEISGFIWHNDCGEMVIRTKEAPTGCIYDQERTAVVRVIGGKVKIEGLYDIYAPADNKIEKLLSTPIDLDIILTPDQRAELKPVLAAGTNIRPSLAPEETGRRVIIITDEVLKGAESIKCMCSWNEEADLYKGDVFLVEDEATYTGYRIGKEEFEGTHALV